MLGSLCVVGVQGLRGGEGPRIILEDNVEHLVVQDLHNVPLRHVATQDNKIASSERTYVGERSDVTGAGHPENDPHFRGPSGAHDFRLCPKNGGRPRCTSTSPGGLSGGMLAFPRGPVTVKTLSCSRSSFRGPTRAPESTRGARPSAEAYLWPASRETPWGLRRARSWRKRPSFTVR